MVWQWFFCWSGFLRRTKEKEDEREREREEEEKGERDALTLTSVFTCPSM